MTIRRAFLFVMGAAALCALSAVAWGQRGFAARRVVLPKITGPILVTSYSYPFMSADHAVEPFDLNKVGYIEKEYFVSGRANVYGYAGKGALKVLAADAPYATRILLRYPADPGKFSGNVIVELLNPSDKYDEDLVWELTRNYSIENGDAWVGITSKPIAAEFLKRFEPKRYAVLSWANPLPADQTCKNPGPALLPGHSSPQTEDGLVWDIVTQVGALLKSDSPTNPLASLRVQYLYQTAYSQTGAYVDTYIAEFQPHALLSNGKPIYDGFLIGGAAGVSAINECATPPENGLPGALVSSSEPVIRIMSLTDFYRFGPFQTYLERRRDSDTPNDRYRLYEVAGAAHVVATLDQSVPSQADVVAGGIKPAKVVCKGPESNFPSQYIYDSALANLERWVRDGTPAPHAARIAVSKPGDPNATVLTDPFGNARDGVRTPAVDVPTATYYGASTAVGAETTPPTCTIVGHMVPFDHARLKKLYPTQADYVKRVSADVDRLVSQRWITAADGQRIKSRASGAPVPQ
ncbi:MAG TPA: alpha/beta hydrolase domain-containing protein [Candidatus Acidoferrales bacterium]